MPEYFNITDIELIEEREPDEHDNRWCRCKIDGMRESVLWLSKKQVGRYFDELTTTTKGVTRFKKLMEPDQATLENRQAQQNSNERPAVED